MIPVKEVLSWVGVGVIIVSLVTACIYLIWPGKDKKEK